VITFIDLARAAGAGGGGERDGKDVLHELFSHLPELLAGLVGVLVRVLVPELLDLPDLVGHRAELGVALLLIERNGLLAEPLESQKVLDATVVAPLAVVRQVILQEDALLADLPEVEAAVEHREELFLILRLCRAEPLVLSNVLVEAAGAALCPVPPVAVHREVSIARLHGWVLAAHGRNLDRRRRLVVFAVVETQAIRVVIIHKTTGFRIRERDTGKFLVIRGGVCPSHGLQRLVHVLLLFLINKKKQTKSVIADFRSFKRT
jgi:hypothetical protein